MNAASQHFATQWKPTTDTPPSRVGNGPLFLTYTLSHIKKRK